MGNKKRFFVNVLNDEMQTTPPEYNKYKKKNKDRKRQPKSSEKFLETEIFPEPLVFALQVSGSAKE